MFKEYITTSKLKKTIEEVLPEIKNLGEVLAIGEQTVVINPSFKTEFDAVLLISSEKEKFPFLKKLSEYYDFKIEELDILEGKETFLMSKMQPIILTDKKTLVTFRGINKDFITISELDFKSLDRIENKEIRESVKIALNSVSENGFLDLHALQFVRFGKEIICIDPVYYEDENSF